MQICMMFTFSMSVNCFLLDQSSLPFIVLIFLLSGVCLYCAGTESNTMNYVTLVLMILVLLFVLFLCWNMFMFFIYYEFLVIILFMSLFLFIASFFKVSSAFYFFMFSLFGSMFFFYVIAVFPVMTKVIMMNSALVFSLPFLVKLPSFPFSYWLPEVHTEANTSISVMLAGLMLKLGIFGMMRYCYMTFDLFLAMINCGLLTLTLIIMLMIMCSFFSFAVDLKKIIAFSSITHLNLTFSALITLNNSGMLTAMITSFAHGLSSVALFLFVGSVMARTYSSNIDSLFFLDFKSRTILLFLLLCNLGFPLTCNFLGELLSVISLMSVSSFFAFMFLLSSLVFTLFWFFMYNRKLPYYSTKLHLLSTEKLIAIWLCILLLTSGTFLVTLFSKKVSNTDEEVVVGLTSNEIKLLKDHYVHNTWSEYAIFWVNQRYLPSIINNGKLMSSRAIGDSEYIYCFVEFESFVQFSSFCDENSNMLFETSFYSTRYSASIYWNTLVIPFMDSLE